MAKENKFSKLEKEVKKEEKILEVEAKKEERGMMWFLKSHTFRIILAVFIFTLLILLLFYVGNTQSKIYIENSDIEAPAISLAYAGTGILSNVFVKEGDYIPKDTVVAEVNGDPIKSDIAGLVIYVMNTPGQIVSAQTPVVKMIDPTELRVVGHIAENKGLADIKVGQTVMFTADAFGSKQYTGVVDSISPVAESQDIVFSISNTRQEQNFDIGVSFDVDKYPELKDGMSAKMWIDK